MNILLIAPEDDNANAYEHLMRVADAFVKDGHSVFFAAVHQYFEKAAGVSLEKYHTFYFNQYQPKNNDEELYRSVSNKVMFPDYFRYDSWKTSRTKAAFNSNIEQGTVQKLIQFFGEIILTENIDFAMYENVSGLFIYAAFLACQKRKIPYIGWIMSRFPRRYELWTDQYGNIPERKRYFDDLSYNQVSEAERKEIEAYIDSIGVVKPDYMLNNASSMKVNYFKYYADNLRKIPQKLGAMCRVNRRDSYSIQHPFEKQWGIVTYKLKRQFCIKLLKKHFADIPENECYFLLPLHYQPESSLSVNAPYYCNQAEVVKNLSLALPLGTKLYVKDHPNGIGFMPYSEYKKILSLPNVRFVSPNANNKRLISNCAGVVTITSTMGYEALLMGKPVITLGNVFYNFHPACIHVNGYEDAERAMREVLSREKAEWTEDNIRFVKTYRDTTYAGNLFDISETSINQLADNILSVAKEKSNRDVQS